MAFKSRLKCLFLKPIFCILFATFLHFARNTTPSGVKVVAKTVDDAVAAIKSGVTDKYKLFIVVESVEDADRLARALDIKEINLGGTKPTDDRHVISTAVYVSDNDEKILKDLMNDGFDVFTQMVPSDKRVNTKDLLK